MVQLCDETDNVSTSLAATASSVKATYDLAASKADTSIATVTTDGLMSAMDKARLDSGGMVYTSLILYVRTGGQAGNDGLTEATPFGTVQQAIDAMHARYRGRITRAYIDVGPGKFESTIITGSYNSGTSFDVLEIGGAGVDATTIQVPSAVDPGHITTTFSLQNCTVEYLRTGSHEYGAFIWQSQIGSKTLRTSNVRIRIHADSAIPSYHLHSGSSSLTYFLNGDLDFEGSSANAPIYISNGSHVEGYGLTSLKFVNGNTDALIWLTSGANAVFPKEVRPSFSNFSYQRTFRLLWGASLTLRSSVKEAWMNGKPNHIDSSSVLKEF